MASPGTGAAALMLELQRKVRRAAAPHAQPLLGRAATWDFALRRTRRCARSARTQLVVAAGAPRARRGSACARRLGRAGVRQHTPA
jgi:hypothetical protein